MTRRGALERQPPRELIEADIAALEQRIYAAFQVGNFPHPPPPAPPPPDVRPEVAITNAGFEPSHIRCAAGRAVAF